MVKFAKPESLYSEYTRKGPADRNTHYCPGCGHGTAHKLIARCIDELGIQDRVVFLSPVGCAAFAYYYFDTGNVACSHGRAPAVGTGIRRTLDGSIIICYQGDGDLAGIGTTEIVHAANRGENITVIFVNNAIYGMTGGQMAPTTPLGIKTVTTPLGRTESREGPPIRISEMLSQLDGPAYIERVALTDTKHVLSAKKAIKKAIRNQMEGRGFSLVEVLSPCPVNWGMSPLEARTWIGEELMRIFPLGVYRSTEGGVRRDGGRLESMDDDALIELIGGRDAPPVHHDIRAVAEETVKIAGFGGQGVLSAGILLANCAIGEGLNATWLPSYGPAMRGGTANASVVYSSSAIGSPVVDAPAAVIVMNGPSLDSFEDSVKSGGTIVVNSSLVEREVRRTDIRALYIPATDEAAGAHFVKGANVILLTVYLLEAGIISIETLSETIPLSLTKREYNAPNQHMIDIGKRLYAAAV